MKQKNARIQSNKVGQPDGEKRTLSQTQGPDDPRPSLKKNEKNGGRNGKDERSEIFSSLQEEEASLMED